MECPLVELNSPDEMLQSMFVIVNRSAFGFFDHLDYVQLPWSSTPNRSIKFAPVADDYSFFPFSYPPLLMVNSQALG